MAYEIITRAPTLEDFTPLDEHQEQTPSSFFGVKPVLHYHSAKASFRLASTEIDNLPELSDFDHGERIEDSDQIEFRNVDVWVTSKFFTVFSANSSRGVQLPYPTISIHAQDGSAVLLELNLSDDNTSDEDLIFLQLRIFPGPSTSSLHSQSVNGDHAMGSGTPDAAKELYDAISTCQELNPDPRGDDEDEDDEYADGAAFDETAPGATGWITSENMNDFVDAQGNFRMPDNIPVYGADDPVRNGGGDSHQSTAIHGADGMFSGAGRTRTADELEPADHDGNVDETKWRRTG